MALNVSLVRRDGVPSDQWGFPVRTLTAYHTASDAATVALAIGVAFNPAVNRVYYMFANDNLVHLQMHDGGAWRMHMSFGELAAATGWTYGYTLYQKYTGAVAGAWRIINTDPANPRRLAFSWRTVG